MQCSHLGLSGPSDSVGPGAEGTSAPSPAPLLLNKQTILRDRNIVKRERIQSFLLHPHFSVLSMKALQCRL